MAKGKDNQKDKQSILEYFFMAGALAILLSVIGLFLFYKNPTDNFYVYPENPKQGDTLYVSVKSESQDVSGTLGKQNLVFYKKDNDDWISFAGIDADRKPGMYTLTVDVAGKEIFSKDITVSQASFIHPEISAVPVPKKITRARQKLANKIITTDDYAVAKILCKLTPKPYFTGAFSNPLKKISISGYAFGQFIGFGKYTLQHLGVDLCAPEKTDVYAINDGKVVMAESLPEDGKIIIIDHGLDIFSMYLHLDQFDVAVGDMVKKGQIIGLSGKTGYVSGPHLHFSVRIGTSKVDPLAFINTTRDMEMGNGSFFASVSGAFNNFINK